MARAQIAGNVLCRYFFQAMMVDEDAPPEEYSSALLLSTQPTLGELQRKFPFVGTHHFRVQVPTKDGSYCWLDLTDPTYALPVTRGQLRVKVLQLSVEPNGNETHEDFTADQVDVPEDRLYDGYFRAQESDRQGPGRPMDDRDGGYSSPQDVGAVLSGVKKALTSKMKQSGLGQTLQKKWDKVLGSTSGSNAPPTAASLAQLAKLVGAMKAPLTDTNRDHVEQLHRLWLTCFDSQPFVLRGEPWETFGFKLGDPLHELQCLLPLQCLVFFHEVHIQIALPMLNEQAMPGNPDTYSYALIASKVAYVLSEILQLKDGACLGLERPFWRLFEDPIAFFELFSIVFRAFDESWRARSSKSIEIAFHMDYATDFAQELLRRGPESVAALVEHAHQMQKW
jgi:hypothetical protein